MVDKIIFYSIVTILTLIAGFIVMTLIDTIRDYPDRRIDGKKCSCVSSSSKDLEDTIS